ncbi:MAG: BlaI/MecI/CopY family transcriptional regulator [Lentisphaeria bacterium]|nr:BlaI/MecI/CopY family transcriptional regulator [Lentisphaeria bacterium]
MARPRQQTPTPAELEVLKVLWDRGPCTVREILTEMTRDTVPAYTSVMSLLTVMTGKGLTRREPKGRAFLYSVARPRERTLGRLVGDLLSRAFEGSASAMVTQLLDQSKLSHDELNAIRRAIDEHADRGGAS